MLSRVPVLKLKIKDYETQRKLDHAKGKKKIKKKRKAKKIPEMGKEEVFILKSEFSENFFGKSISDVVSTLPRSELLIYDDK